MIDVEIAEWLGWEKRGKYWVEPTGHLLLDNKDLVFSTNWSWCVRYILPPILASPELAITFYVSGNKTTAGIFQGDMWKIGKGVAAGFNLPAAFCEALSDMIGPQWEWEVVKKV